MTSVTLHDARIHVARANGDHSPSYQRVYERLVRFCHRVVEPRWATCASAMTAFTNDHCVGDCHCDLFYQTDAQGKLACKRGCAYLTSISFINGTWDECAL